MSMGSANDIDCPSQEVKVGSQADAQGGTHAVSAHVQMGRCLVCLILLIAVAGMFAPLRGAETTEGFTPPHAYPVDRYETGWNRNPFTLKTAPVAVAKTSFATDLAIGSYFGSKDNPTVVVVNTKTGERTSLRLADATPDGLCLKTLTIKPSRKDVVAEVTLGGESAILRFNDSYLRQLTAEKGSPGTPANAKGELGEKTAAGAATKPLPDAQRTATKGSSSQHVPAAPSIARNSAFPNMANPTTHFVHPAVSSGKGVPTTTTRRLQTVPVGKVDRPGR
jgi:hypothetical protein